MYQIEVSKSPTGDYTIVPESTMTMFFLNRGASQDDLRSAIVNQILFEEFGEHDLTIGDQTVRVRVEYETGE